MRPSLAILSLAAFALSAPPVLAQTAAPPAAPPPINAEPAPAPEDDAGATTTPAEDTAPTAEAAFRIDIPTVNLVASNMDEETLRAILSGDIKDHAEELADLNAGSITIPEVNITFTVPGADGQGEIKYESLELTGVVDGVAATASVGAGYFGSPEAEIALGSMEAKDVDLGAILAFYGLVPSPSDEMRTLYRDYTMTGGSIGGEDFRCSFGSVENAEFKGRPLSLSFDELMALSQQMEAEGDEVSSASMDKMARFYADFIYAFESAPTTFEGLDCTGKDETGRPLTISLGGLTMDGFSPGIYPSFSLDDLAIAIEGEGEMSLGNFTLGPIDFSGPATLVRETTEPLNEAWFEANARKLIPAFSGGSLADFTFDFPNEEAEGERIVGSIGGANLSLADWRNGIPTDIAHSATAVSITIPPDSSDETMQQLTALGLTDLNFGYSLAANWDEATSAINVTDFSADARDFGSVVAAAVFGNATTMLFDDSPEMAVMASMGLTFKSVDFDLKDSGLLGIVLEQAAKDQGTNAEALRAILSGSVQGVVLSIMGATPAGTELAGALQTFLTGNKTLTVGIDSKAEAGVPLMTFMAAEDNPALVIDQLDITAKAE